MSSFLVGQVLGLVSITWPVVWRTEEQLCRGGRSIPTRRVLLQLYVSCTKILMQMLFVGR